MAKIISTADFNFRVLSNQEGNQENDRYGEFLTEDKNIVDTFAREFCQNLHDARRKNESTAKVSIKIYSKNNYDYKYLKKITKQLEGPLEQKITDLNPSILLLEEEGTTGLGGSLDILDKGSDHNSFWLHSGRKQGSGKMADANKSGSAGKGNITLFLASEAKTIFVYTDRERAASHEKYVMGKCELRNSFEENNAGTIVRKSYEGFYADIVGKRKSVVPLEGKNELKDFLKAFNIQRDPNEKGSSFVIPFVKTNFTENAILKSILKEYFYLILKGDLEVDVDGKKLDAGSVVDIANEELEEGKEIRDFIENIVKNSWTNALEVKEDWIEGVNSDVFKQASDLTQTQEDFNKNKIICLKVPLLVEKKDGSKSTANFHLFLTRESTKETRVLMRNGIGLSREPYRTPRVQVPYKALLLLGVDELGTYCKAAETPNHIRFDKNMESLTEEYKTDELINHIRKAIPTFAQYFLGIEDKLNREKLDSIISVKLLGPKKITKRLKKKIITPRPPSPPTYSIQHDYFKMETLNGWYLTPGADQITSFPYLVSFIFGKAKIGSPHNKMPDIKSYDPNDFDLGDGSSKWLINSNDINILKSEYFTLEVEITGPDFWMEIQHPIFEEYDIAVGVEI